MVELQGQLAASLTIEERMHAACVDFLYTVAA
jgi:hypothetical protein